MNLDTLADELIKNSKKFIVETRIWDDYPKSESMNAIATFLEKVLIPSIEAGQEKKTRSTSMSEIFKQNYGTEPKRRGSNTPTTKRLRGER